MRLEEITRRGFLGSIVGASMPNLASAKEHWVKVANFGSMDFYINQGSITKTPNSEIRCWVKAVDKESQKEEIDYYKFDIANKTVSIDGVEKRLERIQPNTPANAIFNSVIEYLKYYRLI